MDSSEQVVDGVLHVTSGSLTLTIPVSAGSWGGSNVRLNGIQIPSGRIWKLIAEYMAVGEKAPRETLLIEAKRALMYRQLNSGMIVHTLSPRKEDVLIQGHVYARNEKQRVRPLLERFSIKIAKIEEPVTPDSIREMHEAMLAIGLYPVAAGDDRVMYSPDPEAVFQAFGSRDFVRLYVYLKRPGGAKVSLCLSAE